MATGWLPARRLSFSKIDNGVPAGARKKISGKDARTISVLDGIQKPHHGGGQQADLSSPPSKPLSENGIATAESATGYRLLGHRPEKPVLDGFAAQCRLFTAALSGQRMTTLTSDGTHTLPSRFTTVRRRV